MRARALVRCLARLLGKMPAATPGVIEAEAARAVAEIPLVKAAAQVLAGMGTASTRKN